MRVNDFKDLAVWEASRELTRNIYAITRDKKFLADFGLREQVRRAAVSVMSNIAEGFESGSDSQFARYLCCAKGSAGEIRAHLVVALDEGFVELQQFEKCDKLALQVGRQLAGLIRFLRNRG